LRSDPYANAVGENAVGEEVSSTEATAYDRFMGRYSKPLAAEFAEFADLVPDGRVLEVGCGPGALTSELVARVGAGNVTAADPSEAFLAALRERLPEVEVVQASGADMPFEDGSFDMSLAQLVIHVMDEPVAGLREMARVTREGGVVAACVWDFTDGGPLGPFWKAARALDPEIKDEGAWPGTRAGHLAELFREAGIADVVDGAVSVDVEHATFEDWWEPFTLGAAPSGKYVAGLDHDRREALRERCREMLPDPPFVVSAKAWAARGVA
jgi:SAM-dependent methyltransferase